jgi:hypothetical protein
MGDGAGLGLGPGLKAPRVYGRGAELAAAEKVFLNG